MVRRILFVDHSAEQGGATVALRLMLDAANSKHETITVFVEGGPVAPELRRRGHRVVCLSPERSVKRKSTPRTAIVRVMDLAESVIGLLRVIRDFRPDVVHANTSAAGLVALFATRICRVPLVWQIRDAWNDTSFDRGYLRILRLGLRLHHGGIISNSEYTQQSLLPSSRAIVRVIRSPVDHTFLAPVRQGRSRHDTGSEVRIAIVGRLLEWKGQRLGIRAFASVAEKFPDIRLSIIGAPPVGRYEYLNELVRLVGSLGLDGRVEFLGHIDQVHEELARTDILIHTSLQPEPLGQVVIQAMCAGVPAIAADAGGPAEVIEHGVTGILYALGDQAALERAISRLVEDDRLRAEIACAAKTCVGYTLSPESVWEQITHVYHDLAGRGRQRRML